jgi:hypothetical protein
MLTRAVVVTAHLALLLLAAAGPGPAAAGERHIVDAGGRRLGVLVGLSRGLAEVLLETDDSPVALVLGRDGVAGGVLNATVYASADCTGSSRLLDVGTLLPFGIVPIGRPAGLAPDGRVVAATGAPGATTPVNSVFIPGAVPPCAPAGGSFPTLPASPALDFSGYAVPFSLAGDEPAALAARQPRRRAVAVDGAGEVLGPLAGGGGILGPVGGLPFVGVALFETPSGRAPVALSGNRALFGTALVGYAANDCTGPPLLVDVPSLSGTAFFPPVGVAADGSLQLGGAAAPPAAIGSAWFPLFSMTGCQAVAGMLPTLETTLLDDLGARPQPFGVAVRDAEDAGAGRSAADGLTVFDDAGTALGPVVTAGALANDVVALVQAGRRHGEVRVTPDRLIGGSATAAFTIAGCTGPPLVIAADPSQPEPLYPPTALGPDSVLYSADGPLEIANVQLRWNAETAACEPLSTVGPAFVRRTSVLRDLSPLVPPFAVR